MEKERDPNRPEFPSKRFWLFLTLFSVMSLIFFLLLFAEYCANGCTFGQILIMSACFRPGLFLIQVIFILIAVRMLGGIDNVLYYLEKLVNRKNPDS